MNASEIKKIFENPCENHPCPANHCHGCPYDNILTLRLNADGIPDPKGRYRLAVVDEEAELPTAIGYIKNGLKTVAYIDRDIILALIEQGWRKTI